MDLTHVGTAGARQEFLFEFAVPGNAEIVLAPGELLVVSNPVVMDAGGTWQLTVKEAHWIEAMRQAGANAGTSAMTRSQGSTRRLSN